MEIRVSSGAPAGRPSTKGPTTEAREPSIRIPQSNGGSPFVRSERHRTKAASVAESIRVAVINGSLKDGSRLNLKGIADALGVSVTQSAKLAEN